MEANFSGLITRICDSRVLEPDAEADACGPAFERFVRDRMDEWHAALDAFDQQGTEGLSREVFITRSAKELAVRANPLALGKRTSALAAALRRLTAYDPSDTASPPMVAALRSAWEPAFQRSSVWKKTSSLFNEQWPAPWVVLACRAVVREARALQLDRPSPIEPWLALWARGVWAVPYGDGAVGVWVPRADEGEEGIARALTECRESLWNVEDSVAFGFMPPRSMVGPGCHGVVFFGPGPTDGIDQTSGVWLIPPMPSATVNPPMPTNMPMPPRDPVIGSPSVAAEQASSKQESEREQPESPPTMLDRLRRWIKK